MPPAIDQAVDTRRRITHHMKNAQPVAAEHRAERADPIRTGWSLQDDGRRPNRRRAGVPRHRNDKRPVLVAIRIRCGAVRRETWKPRPHQRFGDVVAIGIEPRMRRPQRCDDIEQKGPPVELAGPGPASTSEYRLREMLGRCVVEIDTRPLPLECLIQAASIGVRIEGRVGCERRAKRGVEQCDHAVASAVRQIDVRIRLARVQRRPGNRARLSQDGFELPLQMDGTGPGAQPVGDHARTAARCRCEQHDVSERCRASVSHARPDGAGGGASIADAASPAKACGASGSWRCDR